MSWGTLIHNGGQWKVNMETEKEDAKIFFSARPWTKYFNWYLQVSWGILIHSGGRWKRNTRTEMEDAKILVSTSNWIVAGEHWQFVNSITSAYNTLMRLSLPFALPPFRFSGSQQNETTQRGSLNEPFRIFMLPLGTSSIWNRCWYGKHI